MIQRSAQRSSLPLDTTSPNTPVAKKPRKDFADLLDDPRAHRPDKEEDVLDWTQPIEDIEVINEASVVKSSSQGVTQPLVPPPNLRVLHDILPEPYEHTALLDDSTRERQFYIQFTPVTFVEILAGDFKLWIFFPGSSAITRCAYKRCSCPTWHADCPLTTLNDDGKSRTIQNSRYCTRHLNVGISTYPSMPVQPRCQFVPCHNIAIQCVSKSKIYACQDHLRDPITKKTLQCKTLYSILDCIMTLEYAAITRVYNSDRYQQSSQKLLCDITQCQPPVLYGDSTSSTLVTKQPAPSSDSSTVVPKPPAVKHPIGNATQEAPIPRKPKPIAATTAPLPVQPAPEPPVSRTGRLRTKPKILEITYNAPQLASKSLAPRRQPTTPPPQPYISWDVDPSLPDYMAHQAITIAEYYKDRRSYTTFDTSHPLRKIVPLFPYMATTQQLEQFRQYSEYFQDYYDSYESFLTRRLSSTSPDFDELITIILVLHHNDKTSTSLFTAAQASPALSALTLLDPRLYIDLALPPNPALPDAHLPAAEEEDDNGSASYEPSVTKDFDESN
jgi:hypothetical protein